jgi:hypothetical protein
MSNGDDERSVACMTSDQSRLAPEEDDPEELDEEVQLPMDAGLRPFDSDELSEAELFEREPDYGDLIDSGWIDRAARIEELDDDRSNSLDVGLTLDLSGSAEDEELGQMVDLDVGALLTPLPREADGERDAARDVGSTDTSFAIGALRELLLPDESDAEIEQEQELDDERFPAFDDVPVPASSRTGSDDGTDNEGVDDDESRDS